MPDDNGQRDATNASPVPEGSVITSEEICSPGLNNINLQSVEAVYDLDISSSVSSNTQERSRAVEGAGAFENIETLSPRSGQPLGYLSVICLVLNRTIGEFSFIPVSALVLSLSRWLKAR
jgi:hypothetical protein